MDYCEVDRVKYYTGIGSRDTPQEVLELMKKLAFTLALKGWILRSGGADGADSYFEKGFDEAWCLRNYPDTLGESGKEIYIPWNGFNNRFHDKWKVHCFLDLSSDVRKQAYNLVRQIPPAPDKLSKGVKLLHSRNMMQVLGKDLATSSKFLVCWAPVIGDTITGGTRTAYELAKMNGIQCFNLNVQEDRERIERFVGG